MELKIKNDFKIFDMDIMYSVMEFYFTFFYWNYYIYLFFMGKRGNKGNY